MEINSVSMNGILVLINVNAHIFICISHTILMGLEH
jgi:hypothetical protein